MWKRLLLCVSLIALAGLKFHAAFATGFDGGIWQHYAGDYWKLFYVGFGVLELIAGLGLIAASQLGDRIVFLMSVGFACFTSWSLMNGGWLDAGGCGCAGAIEIDPSSHLMLVLGLLILSGSLLDKGSNVA